MKKHLVLACAAVVAAMLVASCAPGGELQKKPQTVEDHQVIGAQKDPQAASSAVVSRPASSSALPPSSSAGVSMGTAHQSGTVRDEQDAAFGLRLEWTVTGEGGQVTVHTQLFLDCYSLTVASKKSGFVTVNGEKRSFSTENISQSDNRLTAVLIDEETFSFDPTQISSQGILLEAQWNFEGTYGNQYIDALTLRETIKIGG